MEFQSGSETKQKFLYPNFLYESRKGFIEDADICLIDKNQSSDSIRGTEAATGGVL